jgi:hypothetical protein
MKTKAIPASEVKVGDYVCKHLVAYSANDCLRVENIRKETGAFGEKLFVFHLSNGNASPVAENHKIYVCAKMDYTFTRPGLDFYVNVTAEDADEAVRLANLALSETVFYPHPESDFEPGFKSIEIKIYDIPDFTERDIIERVPQGYVA